MPDTAYGHVVVTGAAGRIGRVVAAGLRAAGVTLSLTDRVAPDDDLADLPFVAADLLDRDALATMLDGADVLVHLGGAAGYIREWATLERVNISGTHILFQAAIDAGVQRIVYASSNHVCGYNPADVLLGPDTPVRPDSPYAVTKMFGENLLAQLCDAHGITGTSMRICSFAERPSERRHLSTWLSHDDTVRLVLAALSIDRPGHHILWGVSNNRRSHVDRVHWAAAGYTPLDDAEIHVSKISDDAAASLTCLGGSFAVRVGESVV